MSFSLLGSKNLFSLASRERCMTNLKKYRIPKTPKPIAEKRLNALPTAAVLVPMCRVNNSTSLLYTVRSANLRNHSGQIAFPGGKSDKDETPIETALRETKEEIGLSPEKVDVWGQGPSIPGRNNEIIITPVIGCVTDLKQEDLSLNKKEVTEVFAVPLEVLCDPRNQFYTQFKNGYILPVFVADEFKIWGLTAVITHVFLSCLLTKDIYNNEWTSKKILLNETLDS